MTTFWANFVGSDGAKWGLAFAANTKAMATAHANHVANGAGLVVTKVMKVPPMPASTLGDLVLISGN